MRLVGLFLIFLVFCKSPEKRGTQGILLLTIAELNKAKEHSRELELTKKAFPEKVILILESQPGTGYSWKEIENKSPLILIEDGQIQTKENIPGGISNTLFTYKINQTGRGELLFLYRQHWQKEDPYEKKLVLKVMVSD